MLHYFWTSCIVNKQQQTPMAPFTFRVGERVTVTTLGSEPQDGTVTELWANSRAAHMSGHLSLDKYYVSFSNGGSGCFYGCDIKLR